MTDHVGPEDHRAISALLYRYARAVDTKDWALYRSVFTGGRRNRLLVCRRHLRPA